MSRKPNGAEPVEPDKLKRMRALLESAYKEAEQIVSGDRPNDLEKRLGKKALQTFSELGALQHAARGVALTLIAYKAVAPAQDIRAHKKEQPGGFSGRAFDSNVTIPFLISKSLPRSVESHWLSQTFSFAGSYVRGSTLKTTPKRAGPLLIESVNLAQDANSKEFSYSAAVALLEQLIRIRNRENVVLTKPKDLSIERIIAIITCHLGRKYKANAPRLPQLVIYAAYECLVKTVGRYSGMKLEPLERMKSADRKSGTVGDIVVTKDGAPVEAVEIKHGQPITYIHVAEAIEKVRAQSVKRYYILSNMDVDSNDRARIDTARAEFLQQNGCEIIINGVVDSLSYYLRMLAGTTEFMSAYATLLEGDLDVNYEHRIAWNECCGIPV